MNINCLVKNLKSGILKAERVVNKTSSLPAIQSILLSVKKNELTIRATNLNIGVEIVIPVKTEEEGVCAISGNVLSNLLLNVSQDEMINLKLNKTTLECKTKHTKVKVKTLPHEDFPTLPKVVGEEFDLEVKTFLDGVKNVYYSSSVTDIKPEISSVYVYSQKDDLVFVATDSFRLAEKRVGLGVAGASYEFLIPFKNVTDLTWLLSSYSEKNMKVVYSNNQLSFSLDGVYITTRLIDGTFPNYSLIIPKEKKTSVIVLKKDLIQALGLSNIFSNKFNQVTLSISPSKKKFSIQTQNSDIGESDIDLDSTLEGDDVEISFNHKYLTDVFQSIASDSVSLEFTETTKPIVVKGVSQNDFLYLIMPTNR